MSFKYGHTLASVACLIACSSPFSAAAQKPQGHKSGRATPPPTTNVTHPPVAPELKELMSKLDAGFARFGKDPEGFATNRELHRDIWKLFAHPQVAGIYCNFNEGEGGNDLEDASLKAQVAELTGRLPGKEAPTYNQLNSKRRGFGKESHNFVQWDPHGGGHPDIVKYLKNFGLFSMESDGDADFTAAFRDLSPLERATIKANKKCPIFEGIEYPRDLMVQDFRHIMREIGTRHKDISYSSESHYYHYSDPKIEDLGDQAALLFSQFSPRALQRAGSPESKEMDAEFRRWLGTDTNTADPKSRLEPIDILGHHLSQLHHFHAEHVHSSRIAREAIQSYLQPDKHPASFSAFTAAGQVNAYRGERPEDEVPAVLHCIGGPLLLQDPTFNEMTLLGVPVSMKTHSAGETIQFGQEQLKILETMGYETVKFKCGDQELSANVKNRFLVPQEVKGGVELADPALRRFQFGADNKLTGVITVGLISESDATLNLGLRAALGANGYKLANASEVENLKADFSETFKKSDLYMPVGHVISVSNFTLGTDKGQKMVFEKKTAEGRTLELVVYMPPGKNKNSMGVSLSGEEASELLASRYREQIAPPFIVNVSCSSTHTAKGWTYAHGVAQEKLGCVGKGESPVVMGADRGFGTSNAVEIASHLKHPMAALDVAAKEGSAEDLFKALEQTGYKPVSNFGKNQHGKIVGPRILQFKTPDGKDVLF